MNIMFSNEEIKLIFAMIPHYKYSRPSDKYGNQQLEKVLNLEEKLREYIKSIK